MLTVQDCLGVCELTPGEIAAIAQHERVPELVAAALGEHLIHCDDGVPRIREMIIDDIADAKARGDETESADLEVVLGRFVATYSDCSPDISD